MSNRHPPGTNRGSRVTPSSVPPSWDDFYADVIKPLMRLAIKSSSMGGLGYETLSELDLALLDARNTMSETLFRAGFWPADVADEALQLLAWLELLETQGRPDLFRYTYALGELLKQDNVKKPSADYRRAFDRYHDPNSDDPIDKNTLWQRFRGNDPDNTGFIDSIRAFRPRGKALSDRDSRQDGFRGQSDSQSQDGPSDDLEDSRRVGSKKSRRDDRYDSDVQDRRHSDHHKSRRHKYDDDQEYRHQEASSRVSKSPSRPGLRASRHYDGSLASLRHRSDRQDRPSRRGHDVPPTESYRESRHESRSLRPSRGLDPEPTHHHRHREDDAQRHYGYDRSSKQDRHLSPVPLTRQRRRRSSSVGSVDVGRKNKASSPVRSIRPVRDEYLRNPSSEEDTPRVPKKKKAPPPVRPIRPVREQPQADSSSDEYIPRVSKKKAKASSAVRPVRPVKEKPQADFSSDEDTPRVPKKTKKKLASPVRPVRPAQKPQADSSSDEDTPRVPKKNKKPASPVRSIRSARDEPPADPLGDEDTRRVSKKIEQEPASPVRSVRSARDEPPADPPSNKEKASAPKKRSPHLKDFGPGNNWDTETYQSLSEAGAEPDALADTITEKPLEPVVPDESVAEPGNGEAKDEPKWTKIGGWSPNFRHVHVKTTLNRHGSEWTMHPQDMSKTNSLSRTYKHPGVFPSRDVALAMKRRFDYEIGMNRQEQGLEAWEIAIPPALFHAWFYGSNGKILHEVVNPETGVFIHHSDVKLWLRFCYDEVKGSVTFIKVCLGPASMNQPVKQTIKGPEAFKMSAFQVHNLRDCFLALRINIREGGKFTMADIFGKENQNRFFYRPMAVYDRLLLAFPISTPTGPLLNAWQGGAKQKEPSQVLRSVDVHAGVARIVKNAWVGGKSVGSMIDQFVHQFRTCCESKPESVSHDTLQATFLTAYQKALSDMTKPMNEGGVITPDQWDKWTPYYESFSQIRQKLQAELKLQLKLHNQNR
ncbi:hypothetical protein QBC41DRAFT_347371 [Cercophora samala]|uniref:Uncharacterized protein n=1 Tax=Cercophora samala TaxID=330535 RepID=A0AA39ZBY0_9PEZI|nr:hypothetical protein QBC41DRAFT_347371 [Cercophora samala]